MIRRRQHVLSLRPGGHSGGLRHARALVLATVAALPVAFATPARAATSESTPPPRRVLVVSLPTLTWSDVTGGAMPALRRLLDSSAVGDLATRADRQPAKLGAAYVTVGAGTRAAGDDATDGEGFAASAPFGGQTAGAVFRQRTGKSARGNLVDLALPRIDGANASLLYDAKPGELGNALSRAGDARAVVANGDGAQPDNVVGSTAPVYFRAAVGALMGSDGTVPAGDVGTGLLERDTSAPYGLRLDPAAVERAFTEGWRDRSVVLVEGSDLVRADRYAAYVSSSQKATQRRQALSWTDHLVARLLTHVDPKRDLVVVMAPVPATGDRSVTVVGLHGPGIAPGLVRSATTRRAGFTTLSDIGPTILDRLGVAVPEAMEGQPMEVVAGHGSAADRAAFLERANAQGLLRDDLVNPVTLAVIWTTIALVVAAVFLLTRVRHVRAALQWVALALVGLLTATLPATLLDFGEHGGKVAYWCFVAASAVVFAGVCQLARRRGRLDPLLWALGVSLAVLVLDQFTGGHLEFNSVFGYSATVGIRFAGIGNQSSALLTTSAILVATLLAWRVRAPRGRGLAIAVLVVSFVAVTPPLFGQDFGGTIAAAPAFALLGWLLLGRRVTVKGIAALAGILLASGLAVGFLDLLRPADQRTHVGRFFAKVGNEGFAGFSTVIERKGGENTATLSSPIYIVLIVVVIAAGVALWYRPPRLLAQAVARTPTLRAGAVALAVLVVLSYALNDSGIAIPAIMLSLIAATGAYLVADAADAADAADVAAPEPTLGERKNLVRPGA